MKHYMVMCAILVARMVELAWHFLILVLDDAERAGHAQMHQQHVAGGKIRHQVFGATAQTGHGLARKPRDKVFLERKPQVFSAGLGFYDPLTLHDPVQAAAGGLDIWE